MHENCVYRFYSVWFRILGLADTKFCIVPMIILELNMRQNNNLIFYKIDLQILV
jgi:hypothetical protein